MHPANPAGSPFPSGSRARAVAIGGLAVGVLDAADGVAYFGISAGLDPIQVLQFIASGAVGGDAFRGGLAAAGLGALIHFALAYGVTVAFVWVYVRSEAIRRHWGAAGLAYGAAVWLLMNLMVLPLTRVQAAPLTSLAVLHGLAGHALFVGLAAAVVCHRTIDPHRST